VRFAFFGLLAVVTMPETGKELSLAQGRSPGVTLEHPCSSSLTMKVSFCMKVRPTLMGEPPRLDSGDVDLRPLRRCSRPHWTGLQAA